MIGGYIYRESEPDLEKRLQSGLNSLFKKIRVWDNGLLFYDDPFQGEQASWVASDELILLSEDVLVAGAEEGEYRRLDLKRDFQEILSKKGTDAFNAVQSDFRMAVLQKTSADKRLYLVSNRAGSGRIYYHLLKSGVLFASDLRFLLSLVPFEVSQLGIYALLKYGAVPEPLTISNNISAVPPAHFFKYDLDSGEYSSRTYFKFQFDFERNDESAKYDETVLEPASKVLQKSARFLGEYPSSMLLSGGIDSSLYGCYLSRARKDPLPAFYCAFGHEDPELPFAKAIAERIGTSLQVATMDKPDAMRVMDEVTQLADHPFSDFSSMPIVFTLKYIKEHMTGPGVVIECNGGDDCFGFPDLRNETKYRLKHRIPKALKKMTSSLFQHSTYWKWESREGILSRIAAIADVHELNSLNYFLVLAPTNYLGLDIPADWDERLQEVMENVFSSCGGGYSRLGYKARTTIKQLLHVNSRRWAAKALSVGQSLGLRIIYPYIWLDVLVQQGKLPWSAKVHNGIVKWPLKKLLEEFMPESFIYRKKSGFVPPFARWLTDKTFNGRVHDILLAKDCYVTSFVPPRLMEELLADALQGRNLRFPILNFLWGAVFTESWIRRYKSPGR